MLPPPENTDTGIVQEAERLMGVAFDIMPCTWRLKKNPAAWEV